MNEMKNNLLSVIMPAYNAEKYIAKAIESVITQSYPAWELIIVDDGSQDGTALIAGNFKHPYISVLQQHNQGEGAARNAALEIARGEYIAFLDADDFYHPDHIELTIHHLQAAPELDGVYTDGLHFNDQGKLLGPLSSRRRGPFEGWIFPEIIRAPDVFGPPGCVVLKASQIHNRKLRFDPTIQYGTDWDFMAQFTEKGKFGYCDQRTYYYRVHENNLTRRVTQEDCTRSWIKCRMKAIKSASFEVCPLDVQWKVFFDLLTILLSGKPEQREMAARMPEFTRLPASMQANLLRLLASSAIVESNGDSYIESWLLRSLALQPGNLKGWLLKLLYHANPAICRWLIGHKRSTKKVQPPSFFEQGAKP